MQVVCMEGAATQLRRVLATSLIKIVEDVEPFAQPAHSPRTEQHDTALTARRLAYLCRQSKARNFHEAVLQGAPEESVGGSADSLSQAGQ